jgi:hypothetical protein
MAMTRTHAHESSLIRIVLVLACFLLALAGSAAAQSRPAPRVKAQLGSGVVRLGERVQLRIAVENADEARVLGLPSVDGLAMGELSGPSTNMSMSSVGGRLVSSSKSWTWGVTLRPEREGEFQIPPIDVLVDGERVSTRALSLKVVRDLQGEDLGFIEIHTTPAGRVVEGQPFSLEIRFGWDLAADVNYASLQLPWWGELFGALELEGRELPLGARTIEGVRINDRLSVTVEELPATQRDGRAMRTLRLVQSFLPTRAGSIEIPTSSFEFGKLVQQRSFFSTGAEKQSSFFVQAAAFALEVVPLPQEGQPFDFGGAVGRIEARASADARDVRVGDSIKLTVAWTGPGNLEFFEAPDPSRLDAFGGFRYYGKTEQKSFERRTVTYDIAPLATEVESIPSLPLTFYDPELERYVSAQTEPIPIRVRPLRGAVVLGQEESARFDEDIRDIDTRPLSGLPPGGESIGDAAVGTAVLGVPLCWLVARTLVRRRRGDPSAPLERRRKRARRKLARALRRSSEPRARLSAFATFLAARTRESEEAWVGRAGRARGLELEALPPEEVERLRALLRRLEGAVYGDAREAVPPGEILDAADELLRAGL